MGRAVATDSRERWVGMEVFYTETPPLGGRLRTHAEDFVVEEIGDGPPKREKGRFLAAKIELVNWEHNHFVRDATRALRLPRRNVGFAGTKDKRAVTTQWFTFLVSQSDEEVVDRLQSMNRVRVLEHHRTERSLRLGQHEGNRFEVTVRDIPFSHEKARPLLDETLGTLAKTGGFPNFFGMQRFGAIRPITHLVGEALLQGDLEKAVMTYVTGPAAAESEPLKEARARILKDRDWRQASNLLPGEAKFELAVAHHLAGKPDDFKGALRRLPGNLVLLFVHAYQSYLFNRILSARIGRGLPIEAPVEGDIVLPASGSDMLPGREPVRVTASNLDRLRRQTARGRAVVTAPLYGYDTPVASGEPGETEARVIEDAGIPAEAFRSPKLPEAASRGLRRGILTPVAGLEWEVSSAHTVKPGDEVGPETAMAVLRFSLPRGAYATTFLREVLKLEETGLY